MTTSTLNSILAVIFALTACAAGQDQPASSPFKFEPREEKFVSPVDRTEQTYLVAEWDARNVDKPPVLVIYLHGSGSHQDQGMTPQIFADNFGRMGRWMASRSSVYICPEYRGSTWMGPAAERDLIEILRLAREKYKPSTVLLTGGSMGGTSALIFAARHPDLLDGVLAWCPATDPAGMFPHFPDQFRAGYGGSPDEVPEVYRERTSRDQAEALARLPVAIVHGSADTLIPVEHSRTLVERLQALEAPVKYVEIKNGGHDAPFNADVVALLEWLMAAPL